MAHRFLSPDTAACFEGVTADQVRADLAEIEAQGWWKQRPPWADNLFRRYDEEYGGTFPIPAALDAAFRFIADQTAEHAPGDDVKRLDPDAYDAAEDVCYWFQRLARATTLPAQARAFDQMANHVSDLESWLRPADRYDNLEP